MVDPCQYDADTINPFSVPVRTKLREGIGQRLAGGKLCKQLGDLEFGFDGQPSSLYCRITMATKIA